MALCGPECPVGRSGDDTPGSVHRPPRCGLRRGAGLEPGDQDTNFGTGQHATWGPPASAPVWSGASRDDLPHNTGEPTNPDLPQQSPVGAAAGQQHEAGPQQAGYGEGWASAPGPAGAGSSSDPAEASRPGPPWAKVTSPWDGPDDAGAEPFVWDDSHQTLVWGAEHQRAKASRLREQDEAAESGPDEAAETGPHEPETRQDTAGPGQDEPATGQATAGPGQDEPATGQATAGPGPVAAGPGEHAPGTGQAAAELGQATAEPGQREPATGQATAGPGQHEPATGQATAGPGQDEPATGQATAGPGQDEPATGQATAEPGQDPADSDHERPLAHSEQDRD